MWIRKTYLRLQLKSGRTSKEIKSMGLKIPERKVEEVVGRGWKEYDHVIQMTSCHLIAMTALYTYYLTHSGLNV